MLDMSLCPCPGKAVRSAVRRISDRNECGFSVAGPRRGCATTAPDRAPIALGAPVPSDESNHFAPRGSPPLLWAAHVR